MEGTARKSILIRILTLLILFTVLSGIPPATEALSIKDDCLLIPMGNTVGIKMQSDGVIVVGINQIDTGKTKTAPGASAGIRIGDIITHLNSDRIQSLNDFKEAINKMENKEITVRIIRDGKVKQFTVLPVENKEGKPQLGIWLRDGIVGIGTITYMDPKRGTFGALGHCVSDIDTGIMIPMKSGTVMKSSILSVKKGSIGIPGELKGNFDLLCSIGNLYANTNCGIFGIFEKSSEIKGGKPILAAKHSEIKAGKATILSNISGTTVEEYEIEISRIYPQGESGVRDMMITVKDERLLSTTGGIVQGMSGSPILQNGKLIGAVTHVLINDPTKGYGISIENMLNADVEKLEKAA